LRRPKGTQLGCSPSSGTSMGQADLFRALHLDKCCEYWYFNYANKDNPNPEEFKFPVEMALELLITADFLDCKHIWIVAHLLSLKSGFGTYSRLKQSSLECICRHDKMEIICQCNRTTDITRLSPLRYPDTHRN
jgi:hypothetical protein